MVQHGCGQQSVFFQWCLWFAQDDLLYFGALWMFRAGWCDIFLWMSWPAGPEQYWQWIRNSHPSHHHRIYATKNDNRPYSPLVHLPLQGSRCLPSKWPCGVQLSRLWQLPTGKVQERPRKMPTSGLQSLPGCHGSKAFQRRRSECLRDGL